MTVKQRGLALRLLEKQQRNPEYAKKLVVNVEVKQMCVSYGNVDTQKEVVK